MILCAHIIPFKFDNDNTNTLLSYLNPPNYIYNLTEFCTPKFIIKTITLEDLGICV